MVSSFLAGALSLSLSHPLFQEKLEKDYTVVCDDNLFTLTVSNLKQNLMHIILPFMPGCQRGRILGIDADANRLA